MENISQVLETIRTYSPDANLQSVMQAYLLAAKAHAGQTRKSGEPYLTHPIAVAGILADRIGRRTVMIGGLLIMSLGYVFYPLATTTEELIIYRCIFAIGVAGATGMLGTITHDYPQESSRGKMIGISSVMIVLGTLFVADVFRRMPLILKERGFDGVTAGQYTFWLAAACVTFGCIVLRLGLKGGTPAAKAERVL